MNQFNRIMGKKYPTFHEYDTNLNLWFEDPDDEELTNIRNQIVKHLRSRGFNVGLDKKTAKSIRRNYHKGKKGDLKLELSLSGRHLELTFYQDINIENRAGGQYDFNKKDKMPYLILKQYEMERNKLAELMENICCPLELEFNYKGMDYINKAREKHCNFHGKDSYEKNSYENNCKSCGGDLLEDGDTVYFSDYSTSYRFVRGIAYRNINNMWWVLLPCATVRNIVCWNLYFKKDLPFLKGRFLESYKIKRKLVEYGEKLKQQASIGIDEKIKLLALNVKE